MLTIDVDRWLHLDPIARAEFDGWYERELGNEPAVQLWLADEGVVRLHVHRYDWPPLFCFDGEHADATVIGTTVHRCVSSLPPRDALTEDRSPS